MLAPSLHPAATIVILALTVAGFVRGRVRTDLVALCALLALVLTGILEPAEAFAGFSNNVIFVVAGMFIVSGAIVRSGLAAVASRRILGVAGRNTNVLFVLVMVLASAIGSLVSNVGTVAIMMPIVVGLALSVGESPSRFLMPLAFMSSIGGMFTLIGNSPNMVVGEAYAQAGGRALTLFSFLPIGAACFLFGLFVLTPLTSWYLSRRKHAKEDPDRPCRSPGELADKYRLGQNTHRFVVSADSALAGQPLRELGLPAEYGVVVLDVSRPEAPQGLLFNHRGSRKTRQITPGPETILLAGDLVSLLGTAHDVNEMAGRCGLVGLPRASTAPEGSATEESEAMRFVSTGVCELVLTSSSRLVNRTVGEADLRRRFGLTVLGIQRGGQYILEGMKGQALRAGDALLAQGAWDDLLRLEGERDDWVVVGRPAEHSHAGRFGEKRPLVVSVIVLMILAMALNLVPTVVAVAAAALVLVLGGCFKNADEAYSAIGWETLVLIAGLLPIATAMQKTGMVDGAADFLAAWCRERGAFAPHWGLAAVYAMASFMNVFISTTPVALLMTPVAIRLAEALGYDALPFLFAVATAASMCFASPFSTPANALVMSAGRYTVMDYMKIGLPLQFLMGAMMVFVLPWLFPFAPA